MALIRIRYRGKLTIKEFVSTSFAVIITSSLYYFWGGIYAEGMAIVFIGYRYDFDKIAKKTISVILITMAFIILSSKLGIITDYNFSIAVATETRTRRYGLGFSYATYPSHYVLLIVMLVIYLKRENIRWITIFWLFGLNLYIYLETASRNSFVLSIVVLIVAIVFKYSNIGITNNFFTKVFFSGAYINWTILQLILADIYNAGIPWMSKLDEMMSRRLTLNALAYSTYKITLFGQPTNFVTRVWRNGRWQLGGDAYTGMDSSYLDILFRNGVVSLAFVLLIFTIAGLNSLKNKDRYMVMILFVIAIHSAFDPQLVHLQYNTFFFWAVANVLKGKRNHERKKHFNKKLHI